MIKLKGGHVVQIAGCCVLGLIAIFSPGSGETETSAKCDDAGIGFRQQIDHEATMLAACRRELAQAHELADEASDLVEDAGANLGKLLMRCAVDPSDPEIRRAEAITNAPSYNQGGR